MFRHEQSSGLKTVHLDRTKQSGTRRIWQSIFIEGPQRAQNRAISEERFWHRDQNRLCCQARMAQIGRQSLSAHSQTPMVPAAIV